jgi:hypothetical protein
LFGIQLIERGATREDHEAEGQDETLPSEHFSLLAVRDSEENEDVLKEPNLGGMPCD